MSTSATYGLEGVSFGLEGCLWAEEAYLLDKRTFIEIESFVSLDDTIRTVLPELRAFRGLEKRDPIFHCHVSY